MHSPVPQFRRTDLAIQSHEEELEHCDLEDLEKDDGIPAEKCNRPHIVESVVLKLHPNSGGK